MYAKTLVPGPPLDLPSLMSTTDDPDVLLPQLRALGWGRFGGPVPAAPAGQLVTSPDRLQLIVGGQAVLDDLNPVSPPGWWKVVDRLGGKCVVVVVRQGDVDLTRPDVATSYMPCWTPTGPCSRCCRW
jgi:hypothetical protein